MEWIREQPPTWDADKVRIIGEAPSGIFDVRFRRIALGTRVPGEWWHVVEGEVIRESSGAIRLFPLE